MAGVAVPTQQYFPVAVAAASADAALSLTPFRARGHPCPHTPIPQTTSRPPSIGDLPAIKCGVCEGLVDHLHGKVSEMREAAPFGKVRWTAAAIIDEISKMKLQYQVCTAIREGIDDHTHVAEVGIYGSSSMKQG